MRSIRYGLLLAAVLLVVGSAPSLANITYRFDGTCTSLQMGSVGGPQYDLSCAAFADQSVEAILVVDNSYVDSSPCSLFDPTSCLFKSFTWIDHLGVQIQLVCDPPPGSCHDVAILTNQIFTRFTTDLFYGGGGFGALPTHGPANFFTYVGQGNLATSLGGNFVFVCCEDILFGELHVVSGIDGVWTRVDEPSALALVGFALGALTLTRRVRAARAMLG